MAKHISRNHFVDISITLGQKRLFRQMGYNLFAKVAILRERDSGGWMMDEMWGRTEVGDLFMPERIRVIE